MIVDSPLPPLAIPDGDFSSFALRRARELPDKVALIDLDTGAQTTYADLTRMVDACAGGLVARGLRPRDIVAICAFNTSAYALVAHAVWRAGGTLVTVNPLFTVGEMQHELADAGARYLVAASEVLDHAQAAARQVGIEAMFTLGHNDGPDAFETLADARQSPPTLSVNPHEDRALILYSSGTTGLPKGVMLTHHNLKAAALQLLSGDLARQEDVLVAVSPFFHVVGLHGILNLGLVAGATTVIVRRFDLGRFLEAVQKYRISSAFLTPPVVNELVKNPLVSEYDLGSLRSILCAAAPLGPEAETAAAERLGCTVRQGYGMTEATGPVSTNLVKPDGSVRRGSVGQLVPGTEAKIEDLADARELGAGETGEILVRGPQVMRGYLNNPEATAVALEAGGWLHTGDVGYADAEGYLWIVDRVKEIIKYKAYQVAPAELEAVLGSHPSVQDVAVVPSPEPDSGEVPKAFVVLKAGNEASGDELMSYVAERVAPYKKVRMVEFVDVIPKSPTGKILRRVLVERERQSAGGGARSAG
ncbi:MAG: AMP-binding protein [Chloroflexi bacterium]|nr:AMP-binding protein [Chloroflexota bacterium]